MILLSVFIISFSVKVMSWQKANNASASQSVSGQAPSSMGDSKVWNITKNLSEAEGRDFPGKSSTPARCVNSSPCWKKKKYKILNNADLTPEILKWFALQEAIINQAKTEYRGEGRWRALHAIEEMPRTILRILASLPYHAMRVPASFESH